MSRKSKHAICFYSQFICIVFIVGLRCCCYNKSMTYSMFKVFWCRNLCRISITCNIQNTNLYSLIFVYIISVVFKIRSNINEVENIESMLREDVEKDQCASLKGKRTKRWSLKQRLATTTKKQSEKKPQVKIICFNNMFYSIARYLDPVGVKSR